MEINKIKIAVFTTSFLPVIGGSQYELKWLMNSMDKLLEHDRYKKLELYFFAPNKESLKYAKFKNIKVRNLNLKSTSKLHFLRNIFKLRKMLKKIKPDLLYCFQGVTPDGLMVYLNNLVSLKKQRYIIVSHGGDIVVLPEIGYGIRSNLFLNYLTKLVLRKVEKHVLPSTALIDFAIEAGTNSNKIKVIPNGLEPVKIKNNQELINQFRKRWDIDDKKDFCLLSFSSLRAIKNLDCLVEGFAKAQQIGNLKLFLTCEGNGIESLKLKVKKLKLENNIKFIGPVEGKMKDVCFKICDVFCLVSLFENFPISVLEAMDYGKVVLVSKVGGLKDFITHKYNGIFVKPNDIKDITDKIIEIYRNKEFRKKIGENAKKSVKKYYIDNIAEQYLDLYNTV